MRVLIPVDGSHSSLCAVEYVVRCRSDNDTLDIELVHVLPTIPQYVAQFVTRDAVAAYRRDLATAAVVDATRLLTSARIAHRVHVASGPAAEVVARRAAETACDLIVVGTRRRNALLRLCEGSFSIRLLQVSPVPVELVPGDQPSVVERIGNPAGVGAGLATLLAL